MTCFASGNAPHLGNLAAHVVRVRGARREREAQNNGDRPHRLGVVACPPSARRNVPDTSAEKPVEGIRLARNISDGMF